MNRRRKNCKKKGERSSWKERKRNLKQKGRSRSVLLLVVEVEVAAEVEVVVEAEVEVEALLKVGAPLKTMMRAQTQMVMEMQWSHHQAVRTLRSLAALALMNVTV